MDADRGIALAQKLSYAHYSATGANARDKRLGALADRQKLRPDLRTGGFEMRLRVGRI